VAFAGSKSNEEADKLEVKFTEALNNYLENAVDFNEDRVQRWFEEFENTKTDVLKKIKSGASKVSKGK
jgi:hypothetical protein